MDEAYAVAAPEAARRNRTIGLQVSAVIGLVLAGALAAGGRGTFEHRVLTGAIALAGLLLMAVAAMVHGALRQRRVPRLRRVARVTLFAGVIGVLQLASLGMGLLIHDRDVTAARLFCERAIGRLEEVRQRRGTYPGTLEEAFGEPYDTPFLFRRSGVFVSSSDAFVLSFDEADGVIPHIVQYSSDRRTWTRF